MCGRYNVTSLPLTRLLMDLVGLPATGPERLNLAPTDQAPVLRLGRTERAMNSPELVDMRWWLTPFWAKELSSRYAMFNARAENLARSPAFREPFAKRRCLVPVSGFFEWLREDGQKLPMQVQRCDGVGLSLAGIWDSWRQPDGSELLSFAVVTTAVHDNLAFLHNRQPVLLGRDQALAWLAQDTPRATLDTLLQPQIPWDLTVTPMSTAINNARNKGPDCLAVMGNPRLVAASPK